MAARAATYNPAMARDWRTLDFRNRCATRIASLDTARWSWWQAMRELTRFINPRLGRFLETPNVTGRGRPKNQAIINSTATTSSKRCAAGLMAGICSPSRPWFKLAVGRTKFGEGSPAQQWLALCEERMGIVLSESNFYRSIATMFEDIAVVGTGVMLVYEDFEDVLRCEPVAPGEYYLAVDARLQPSTFGRKIAMTVSQVVGQFGIDRVSENIRTMYTANSLDQEVMISHLIMPNDERVWGDMGARGSPFIEVYWEDSDAGEVLRVRGFNERPFCAARWTVTGNDAYGRSLGMDALSDVKQLQVMEKSLAQAIAKMINPPMTGPTTLKHEGASVIPGAITWLPPGTDGQFKPVYELRDFDIAAMQGLIARVEQRIKTTFFEDLFLMISQLDTVRTATEITARKEEQMLQLGPALERLHDELLRITIERLFGMMHRAGLLPPAPQEIASKFMTVEFISTLAQAQKATATTTLERLLSFVGNMAAVYPEVRDKVDPDQTIDEYADAIGASPTIIVSAEKVAQIRAARAKQAQQQQTLQTGLAAAQGGKVLSDTEVGGGQNALQKVLGYAA